MYEDLVIVKETLGRLRRAGLFQDNLIVISWLFNDYSVQFSVYSLIYLITCYGERDFN